MAATAALPGVTELGPVPETLGDRELSALLDARVRGADVVAIGESVHGSAGFLRLQTRLIRYLVERQGIRLIVWENPTLRSLELARWVASCATAETRTPAPVDVLYMPTAADVPLWAWICDYNRLHPSAPILFRGMDVWDRPWEHYARIATLAPRAGVDPGAVQPPGSCPAQGAAAWPEVEAALAAAAVQGWPGFERCRAALAGILDRARRLGIERQAKQAPDAGEAFELALSASTLLGWLGFHHHVGSDDVASWNERDRAQGRNLMLIMEQHGTTRAILSAHTSHVSHNRSPADWWGYGDLKSGVYFFQALSGRKVFNIALTAYEASGTQGEWLLPTAANSMDRKLHEAGHRLAFFPAGAPFLSEHVRWWMQNGNAVGMENGVELVPRDHFDAWFFLERSVLDRALPARPMWQP